MTAAPRHLLQIADGLDAILEEEAKLLAAGSLENLELVIARKHQLALEVTRSVQHTGALGHDDPLRARFAQTARRLRQNAELLERHKAAVGEIVSVISALLREAGSDGTYSRTASWSGSP